MLRHAQHERNMVVTANTKAIALSTVEGRAQSSRSHVPETGIVDGWNNGLMRSKPSTPIFQYSNTPFHSSASEIFLSSLQTEFNNC